MEVQRVGKCVEIWLTREDQRDPAVQEQLYLIYQKCKKQGLLVAEFRSGRENLTQKTSDLLCYNRKRIAQLQVQRERER